MKRTLRRKSKGQSLVEFAFVFPLIMLFFFATLDMGYYVYGWSETQFAARRGGEQASILPPREVRDGSAYHAGYTDSCLEQIFIEAARSGSFNNETRVNRTDVFISFHMGSTDNTAATNITARAPGRIIQVRVRKRLSPLTPVGDTLVGDTGYVYNAISRRTIVNTEAGGANPQFTGCN